MFFLSKLFKKNDIVELISAFFSFLRILGGVLFSGAKPSRFGH